MSKHLIFLSVFVFKLGETLSCTLDWQAASEE